MNYAILRGRSGSEFEENNQAADRLQKHGFIRIAVEARDKLMAAWNVAWPILCESRE